MPSEGGIVTDHRHEINFIGAQQRALQVEKYLEYFKRRVFAGLGCSAVDFGEGDSATRSTSDNMSRNLIDSVKDVQRVVEDFFNKYIIYELLLESDFQTLNPLDEENRVYLKFHEIDIDARKAKESHAADMFMKNAITLDELRMEIGREPIEIPNENERRNSEDLSIKYPEFSKLFFELFDKPKLIIQAVDEPYLKEAQQAKALAQAQQNMPAVSRAAQTVRPTAPKKQSVMGRPSTKNMLDQANLQILTRYIDDLERFTKNMIVTKEDVKTTKAYIDLAFEKMREILFGYTTREFYAGFQTVDQDPDKLYAAIESNRQYLNMRVRIVLERLRDDLTYLLESSIDELDVAFDLIRRRADYIDDYEIKQAFFLGQTVALQGIGVEKVTLQTHSGSCERCRQFDGTELPLDTIKVSQLPPHHPNCTCQIKIIR
jgi:hypothetical protein